MRQGAKTGLTLAVLVALLVLAASWGWSALTAPMPRLRQAAACVETPVSQGDTISLHQVTVSVLNAGRRSGLASRTMTSLTDAGFTKGDSANAPARTAVRNAQIWTDDPDSPAVALLATWVPHVKVVQHDVDQVGVVLVVGDSFRRLGKGKPSVKATKPTTICSPPT
ncbi:LytR C-terminal domain-containing protein [Nocardioides sp. AN3]